MKDFIFVKFNDGTSDCVYKGWMLGTTKCHWPPKNANVRSLVKRKAEWKEDWKLCNCEVQCQSSEFKYICICMQYEIKRNMCCLF